MRIVFFGSAHFGLPALQALIEAGHSVSCVVTQPDRKKGRGLHIAHTIIKDFANASNIEVFQPENINTKEAIENLKKYNAEFFVIIAYGQILSKEILSIPALMPINAHASILPAYRGAAPINWALINGERETGISIIKMTEKMDTGPILNTEKISIEPDDNTLTLEKKLSEIAAPLMIKTLEDIKNNNCIPVLQDNFKATKAPKLKKRNGQINWNHSACEIHNLIRGCAGWPNAFTYYRGKLLKILSAEIVPASDIQTPELPGRVIEASKNGIIIMAAAGGIRVKELQMEGKRAMSADEFIAGHKIRSGEVFP